MRWTLAIPLFLFLTGCANSGSGVKWYAPATWFSHAPADKVDKTAALEDKARSAVIKRAQVSAHETSLALAAAPDSRPVEVARETSGETVVLLDQAAGSLDAATAQKLRTTIAGLLSERAEIRAEAEKARKKEQEVVASVSAKLAEATSRSQKAEADLRAAFERENALANELRAQRALFWIACGVAILLSAGWLYVKMTLGGVPSAIGAAMSELKMKHPDLAKQVAPFYQKYLNRNEQMLIARRAQTP
jgi:hypothetical protein